MYVNVFNGDQKQAADVKIGQCFIIDNGDDGLPVYKRISNLYYMALDGYQKHRMEQLKISVKIIKITSVDVMYAM